MTDREIPPHYQCSVCGQFGHNARKHSIASQKRIAKEKILLAKQRKIAPLTANGSARIERSLVQDPKNRWTGREGLIDFANDYWKWLGHTNPPTLTRMQEEMCDFIQNGPEKIAMLAPRGVGKSTLLGAAVCRWLKLNQEEKIIVISKSGNFAKKWTGSVLRMIRRVPELEDLKPSRDQDEKLVRFDVAGNSSPLHSSVVAFGIEEQVEGARGTIVIADDVETKKNTRTPEARELLFEQTADFRNLRILGMPYRIIYIGTVHHSDTLYYKLADRGFTIRKWTIAYPSRTMVQVVGEFLAPSLLEDMAKHPALMDNGVDPRVGRSTDPIRFDDKEIKDRIEAGWSNFMMQSMLTPLFGEHRCPLRLRNLIIMERIDFDAVPMRVDWSNSPNCTLSDLSAPGFGSDRFFGPSGTSEQTGTFEQVVMALDPASTQSEDDFAYCIAGRLNGQIFVLDIGTVDEMNEDALGYLANLCVQFRVNTVFDETNYAGGIFRGLFGPILQRICDNATPPWRCGFDPKGYKRSGESKERTVVEIVDNLTSAHRLIFARAVVEKDGAYKRHDKTLKRSEPYRLFHQYTHIMPDVRECLSHDDRIDALSMAIFFLRKGVGDDRERRMEQKVVNEQRKQEEEFLAAASTIDGRFVVKPPEKRRWVDWTKRSSLNGFHRGR